MNKRKTRHKPWWLIDIRVLMLTFLLGTSLLYVYWSRSDIAQYLENFTESSRWIIAENVEIFDYFGNTQRWQLKGEKAKFLEDSSWIFIDQAEIWFMDDATSSGQNPIYAQAQSAELNTEGQLIRLQGQVRLERSPDWVLFTEDAVYHYQTKEIAIGQPLKLLQKDSTIFASSMTYSLNSGKLHLNTPTMMEGNQIALSPPIFN